MKKNNVLQHIVNTLEGGDTKQTYEQSLANVHYPGMFSLVISGEEHGKLTRIFIADKKLKPFGVQLHTHRYPLTLTAIQGEITQITARRCNPSASDVVNMNEYNYESYLTGGKGLTFSRYGTYQISQFNLPPGSSIDMGTSNFHTMSCSRLAMWVVEEHGFTEQTSKVLGVPFVQDGLYMQPLQYQVTDKIQAVLKAIKPILQQYQSV